MGTHRFKCMPEQSVCDQNGELWECNVIYLLDSSTFLTSIGSSPMDAVLMILHMLIFCITVQIICTPIITAGSSNGILHTLLINRIMHPLTLIILICTMCYCHPSINCISYHNTFHSWYNLRVVKLICLPLYLQQSGTCFCQTRVHMYNTNITPT